MRGVVLYVFGIVGLAFASCGKPGYETGSDYYHAAVVPETLARLVAERLPAGYFAQAGLLRMDQARTSRNDIRAVDTVLTIYDSHDSAALYIFNYNGGGFVVISAEFRHEPVCAWIERGRVTSTDSVPGMLAEWFWKKLEDIRFLRDGVYDNTARGYAAWRQLFKETGITLDSAQYRFPDISSDPDCDAQWTVVNKGPLIQTTWGQGCTFNNLCPSMGCVNPQCNAPNAWTGCIATAMAQVVRFWQPVTVYQYDYGSMPLAFGNSEVQRLMRDIGRPESVDMDYQCHGSFADGSRIPGALVGRFGFSSAHRGPYASSSYLSVLQNLDSGWPVILAGCASRQRVWLFFWKYSNCHEWICDGYRELRNPCFSYLWMHMNWGWHEVNGPTDFNGWYLFNNWNIPGVQRNYRYATELTHNIHL